MDTVLCVVCPSSSELGVLEFELAFTHPIPPDQDLLSFQINEIVILV